MELYLESLIACPVDGRDLTRQGHRLTCGEEGHLYGPGKHGYLELARGSSASASVDPTTEECAAIQEHCGLRQYEVYVEPWLQQGDATIVLDAGCGVGRGVMAMRDSGLTAVGVDVGGVADYWQQKNLPPEAFVVGDVTALPFHDSIFDAVISLGVAEHIATLDGRLTSDWKYKRARYANELCRVTRPGGRILLACPNKRFPIDVQHGPNGSRWRMKVFERFGVNIHPIWGTYYLPGYDDLNRWFGKDRIRALPLKNYFGFSALDRPGIPGVAGRLARAWVDAIPAGLRTTALNPYVLAEIQV
jgi:SAM-dependent methyltransferase